MTWVLDFQTESLQEDVDTHYSKGIKYLSRPNSYDVVEKSDRVIVVYLEDTAKYTLLDKYGWI